MVSSNDVGLTKRVGISTRFQRPLAVFSVVRVTIRSHIHMDPCLAISEPAYVLLLYSVRLSANTMMITKICFYTIGSFQKLQQLPFDKLVIQNGSCSQSHGVSCGKMTQREMCIPGRPYKSWMKRKAMLNQQIIESRRQNMHSGYVL